MYHPDATYGGQRGRVQVGYVQIQWGSLRPVVTSLVPLRMKFDGGGGGGGYQKKKQQQLLLVLVFKLCKLPTEYRSTHSYWWANSGMGWATRLIELPPFFTRATEQLIQLVEAESVVMISRPKMSINSERMNYSGHCDSFKLCN
uniref:Uncharacterized protein n=1 Tax=Nelumbo nucifera TaxID=4432 RepID=A0A822Y4Y9_NELNU|nr:TPA_asm: hypothetical protein HUJ06_028139 [Nelumbo nucifera]